MSELSWLGAGGINASGGGVSFCGDLLTCYRANLESRIASRILWQVAAGPYASENDLYEAAYAVAWNEWFDPGLTIRVNVSAIKSPLISLDFVTLKIKDAVCDKFRTVAGRRPSVDTRQPDMRIHAHLSAADFILYLDTSGEALFKRCWRKNAGEAPLRENLAAGILRLAGWEPGIPLLDPMCGAATFLIEAALTALDIAPGHGRNFAFEKFNDFDSCGWQELRGQSKARQKSKAPLPIYGADLYGNALKAARDNLAFAQLDDVVSLKQANVLEISPPAAQGIIVTNPPYGVRIGEQQELAVLYPKLGDALKRKFSGWRVYIFSADQRLPRLIRLSASRRTPLYNGALECRLYEYKIAEGRMRREKTGDR